MVLLRLGLDIETKSPVELSPDNRRQGTYIAGVNGTGKTILLMNTALSDAEQIVDFIAYFLRNYISTPFENNLFGIGAYKRKIEMLKSLKRIIDRKLIIKPCK